MSIMHFLQKAEKFEIQAYARPKNIAVLRKTHVAFTGTLLKHPYDKEMVILIPDPYSTHNMYYEFKTDDISFIQDLPNLVSPQGEAITMVRIWIKKMAVAVCCEPFIVDDIRIEHP